MLSEAAEAYVEGVVYAIMLVRRGYGPLEIAWSLGNDYGHLSERHNAGEVSSEVFARAGELDEALMKAMYLLREGK